MFSNITDAWERDPVREITNKLTTGSYHMDNNPFRYKNEKNKINNSRIKKNDDSSISLSDNSIRLSDIGIDYSPYAPVDFGKKTKKKYSLNTSDFNTSDSSESSGMFGTNTGSSKCSFSTRHIKKCSGCHDRLKKMVNKKVTKKFDEMMLEYKMKQLQNTPPPIQQPVQTNTNYDSWKEILIIVIGGIIALFIIFLIVKCLYK